MSTQTRIYAGGALAFGKQGAIDSLINSDYTAIIVWSVHVTPTGTLILNNTQIVSDGVYHEAETMNLPTRLAKLHKAGIEIIFSVGAGGTSDFTNIATLLNGKVVGPGNPLYDNFAALKKAMVDAGGDINAIDFDNEDNLNAEVMTNFGSTLAAIGYDGVTFCPYGSMYTWQSTYSKLIKAQGADFVKAFHLQCYSGGVGQNPNEWGKMIAGESGSALLIPGLATNQADPGPWWNGRTDSRGGSVVQTDNVAMYGEGYWSGELRRGNYASADDAMKDVKGGETFFFYCSSYMDLGPGKVFQAGDAVFFGGKPWWGSAPQATGYSLSGGCSNIYNPYSTGGACPSDLQTQYATWKKDPYAPQGGFIWLYDSIVNCLLSDCCGEGKEDTAQITRDYAQAIIKGLS